MDISNSDYIKKNHVIFMIVYYNYELIERCLKSFASYLQNNNVDIYFLENPSIYSNKIKKLAIKYSIKYHYMCSENIGGCIIECFLRQNKYLMDKYNYISITESDIYIERGSIEESLDILNNNTEVGVASIQINCSLEKYKNLPTKSWVPCPIKYKTFYKGITGAQFMTVKPYILVDFLERLKHHEIIGSISLGEKNFYGFSDTNLLIYMNRIEKVWGLTNLKLDHTGWEQYLDKNGNLNETNDYCVEKKKNVYKIRSNIILDNIETYNFNLIN